MFTITKQDKNSLARVGTLTINKRTIETPAYVIVGTDAEVRCLTAEDLSETKTQIVIANTYHLWQGRKYSADDIQRRGGLHRVMNFDGIIMTDSGGFQVFSHGFSREHKVGKIASMFPYEAEPSGFRPEHRNVGEDTFEPEKNLVRITNEGVFFSVNGKEAFLGPKESMSIQAQLGADIILAFDECTSPLHGYEYTRDAMVRTHRWAKTCISAKTRSDQMLYGIVQGGAFEDLRKSSAQIIGDMPFNGFAIGGSLGKSRQEMLDVLRWSVPLLSADKPRHLLGIGRIEDIFDAVSLGIDTFDCVIPTREARHGAVWTKNGRIDLNKGRYSNDESKIQDDCSCPACRDGIARLELRALFKTKDPRGCRLLTMHNVYFFNDLMRQIREAVAAGEFEELRKEYLQLSRQA